MTTNSSTKGTLRHPHDTIATMLNGQTLNNVGDVARADTLVNAAVGSWFKPNHRQLVIAGLFSLKETAQKSQVAGRSALIEKIETAVNEIRGQSDQPPVQHNGAEKPAHTGEQDGAQPSA